MIKNLGTDLGGSINNFGSDLIIYNDRSFEYSNNDHIYTTNIDYIVWKT
jgi:hypothetical protein